MSDKGDFSAIFKQYLEETTFSLRRLSEKTGIPKGTLRHWLNGDAKPTHDSWQRVVQIAGSLELDADQANRLLRAAD